MSFSPKAGAWEKSGKILCFEHILFQPRTLKEPDGQLRGTSPGPLTRPGAGGRMGEGWSWFAAFEGSQAAEVARGGGGAGGFSLAGTPLLTRIPTLKTQSTED